MSEDRSIWSVFNLQPPPDINLQPPHNISLQPPHDIDEQPVNKRDVTLDTDEDLVLDEDAIEDITIELPVDEEHNNVIELVIPRNRTKHKELTFIDFLKTKHGTGIKAGLVDGANDETGPRTEHGDPEHDPELVALAEWVISMMEDVDETRRNCVRDENNQYQCSLCGYMTQQRQRYLEHLDHHISAMKQTLIPCGVCDVQLPEKFITVHRQTHEQTHPTLPDTIESVERHLHYDVLYFLVQDYPRQAQHDVYNCRYCDEKFKSINHYRSHFIVHHSLKYMCTLCRKPLYSYLQIYQHMEHHKTQSQDPDRASPTGISSLQITDVVSIQEQVNDGEENDTGQGNKVVDGQINHGQDVTGPVGVGPAGVGSGSQAQGQNGQGEELEWKIVLKNLKHEGRKVLCSICQKSFHRICMLKEHIEFMHKGREPIKCKECPSQFRSMESYRRHMKTHTVKDANCVCATCGACFKTAHQLNSHKRKHYKREPYTCITCHTSFAKKDSLEIHLVEKQHFSPQQPESSIRYKKCSVCGKLLANSNHLFKHMDYAHDNSKICPYCKKSFNYRANMLAHIKSHEKNNPTCNFCGLWFRSHVELQKHLDELHSGFATVAPPSRLKKEIKAAPRNRTKRKRLADKALQGIANSKLVATAASRRTHGRQITKKSSSGKKYIKPFIQASRDRAKRKHDDDDGLEGIADSEQLTTTVSKDRENSTLVPKISPTSRTSIKLVTKASLKKRAKSSEKEQALGGQAGSEQVTKTVPQETAKDTQVSKISPPVMTKIKPISKAKSSKKEEPVADKPVADKPVADELDSEQVPTTVPQDATNRTEVSHIVPSSRNSITSSKVCSVLLSKHIVDEALAGIANSEQVTKTVPQETANSTHVSKVSPSGGTKIKPISKAKSSKKEDHVADEAVASKADSEQVSTTVPQDAANSTEVSNVAPSSKNSITSSKVCSVLLSKHIVDEALAGIASTEQVATTGPQDRDTSTQVSKVAPSGKKNIKSPQGRAKSKNTTEDALEGIANSEQVTKTVPQETANRTQVSKVSPSGRTKIKPISKAKSSKQEEHVADEIVGSQAETEQVPITVQQDTANSTEVSTVAPSSKKSITSSKVCSVLLSKHIVDEALAGIANSEQVAATGPQDRDTSTQVSKVAPSGKKNIKSPRGRAKSKTIADNALEGVANNEQVAITITQDRNTSTQLSNEAPQGSTNIKLISKAASKDTAKSKNIDDDALEGISNSEQATKTVPKDTDNSTQESKVAPSPKKTETVPMDRDNSARVSKVAPSPKKHIKPFIQVSSRDRSKSKDTADEALADIANSEQVATILPQDKANSKLVSLPAPQGRSDKLGADKAPNVKDDSKLVKTTVPKARSGNKPVSKVVTRVRPTKQVAESASSGKRPKSPRIAVEAQGSKANIKEVATTVPQDAENNSKHVTKAENTKQMADAASQGRTKSTPASVRVTRRRSKSPGAAREASRSSAETKMGGGTKTNKSKTKVEIHVENPLDNMALLAEVAMGNFQHSPAPDTQAEVKNVTDSVTQETQAEDSNTTNMITVQADVHKATSSGATQVETVLDTIVDSHELEEQTEVDNVTMKAEVSTATRVDLNSMISKAYDKKVKAEAEKMEGTGNDADLLLAVSDEDNESNSDNDDMMDSIDELQEMDEEYVYTL